MNLLCVMSEEMENIQLLKGESIAEKLTELHDKRPTYRDSFPSGVGDFSLYQIVEACCATRSASYLLGTLSSKVQTQGRDFSRLLTSSAEIQEDWNHPLQDQESCWAFMRVLYIYIYWYIYPYSGYRRIAWCFSLHAFILNRQRPGNWRQLI